MDCNGMHWIGLRSGPRPGLTKNAIPGHSLPSVLTIRLQSSPTEVTPWPTASSARPSWRRPCARHTVYVRKLFLLAGQTYRRHHIIPAAVAAGVISEVKAGAGADFA